VFRFAARTGGEIDLTTSNAIKDDNRLIGISLEEDVSTERIWDEINKSWGTSKDFNRYLGFTKYKMWDQIFPGSKIKFCRDFVVVIANLFKNESTDRLEDKLVQSYKIESDTAKKVVFFIETINL
jgi:tRNA nucleotidyltransferase/poly(A) polymerase